MLSLTLWPTSRGVSAPPCSKHHIYTWLYIRTRRRPDIQSMFRSGGPGDRLQPGLVGGLQVGLHSANSYHISKTCDPACLVEAGSTRLAHQSVDKVAFVTHHIRNSIQMEKTQTGSTVVADILQEPNPIAAPPVPGVSCWALRCFPSAARLSCGSVAARSPVLRPSSELAAARGFTVLRWQTVCSQRVQTRREKLRGLSLT